MPYKSTEIKIEGTKYDKRRKITEQMRRGILEHKGKLSQRKTAKKFGVSRRSVIFIWYPERLERHKELSKERRIDGRYYDRKKHTQQMKKHRRRKHRLYKEGKIKLKDNK